MAWTTPRTWSNGEIPTAAMLNAHLRDNLNVIKVTRNAAGRITDLSSVTVADLAATNVTGLAKAAAANSFTAGRTRMTGTARIVVPVGADKYVDLGGGLRAGVWVEGDYLHHIASDQTTEWRYLGEVVSTPAGAVLGSLWVEGEYLHYIDADGDERRCQSLNASSAHADAVALAGSAWVETYLHWVREAGATEIPGHADVAHVDGSAHSDTHSDTAHSDTHSDTGHADSHGDEAHEDTAHEDAHGDTPHVDDHGDVIDPHLDTHTDTAHVDQAHEDVAHQDESHNDSHSDTAHADAHSDAHTDAHTDHTDHGDVVHTDQPTVNA